MTITPMMLMAGALVALAYINWTLHRDLARLAVAHNENADLLVALAEAIAEERDDVHVERQG